MSCHEMPCISRRQLSTNTGCPGSGVPSDRSSSLGWGFLAFGDPGQQERQQNMVILSEAGRASRGPRSRRTCGCSCFCLSHNRSRMGICISRRQLSTNMGAPHLDFEMWENTTLNLFHSIQHQKGAPHPSFAWAGSPSTHSIVIPSNKNRLSS